MSSITWMNPSDAYSVLNPQSGSDQLASLMQMGGRQLALSVEAKSLQELLKSVLTELSTEITVQWLSVWKKNARSEWKMLGDHGRHGLGPFPVRFCDDVLDRAQAGLQKMDSGWTAFAVPVGQQDGPADLLVGATRTVPENLLAVATIAADSLALALKVAESQLEAWRRVDQLKSTLKIASRLSQTDEMAPLMDAMAEEATRLLDCDRSSIFLWDQDRNEVEARPALGVASGSLRLPAGEGIVGETLTTEKAIIVNDPYSDPRFNQDVDRKSGYVTRNLVCVPLRDADGKVIGAFEGINRNDDKLFNEADVDCLEQLGTQAAVAVQNLREMSLLNRSRDQLAETVAGQVQIVGDSSAIAALRDTVQRLASTDLPVLVLGESGTGKEVVANAIHFGGPRAQSPFVAVNCAAIAESLLESELFGHEEGAFTDARSARQGKFELADGGTLFLDEVGDMSLGGQAKLLRVLEQKVITRVGGSETIPVNVRIVAATNANLAESVRDKKFREDLYYRLSVVTLDLPSLRDRPEDILPLAEHFLKGFAEKAKRPHLQLTPDARRRLQSHAWPGNIRELRNLMERVAYMAAGDRVEVDDLAFILSPEEDNATQLSLDLGLDSATKEFQKDFIRRSIKQVKGNMTDAARLLGLHRSNLYRKMKQLKMSEVGNEDDPEPAG